MKKELIKKIMEKKEFSQLSEKDVLLAFEKFDKEIFSDEEKIKKTRELLRKAFSAFTSRKLLLLKERDEDWFLKKHLSTRERFPNYEKIYKRILKNSSKKLTIIDLGSGIKKSEKPVILNKGDKVKNVAEKIFGNTDNVKEALITGPSSKFLNQKTSLNHELKDLDIVEFKVK